MNLAELDAILKNAGHPGIAAWTRTYFRGATMTSLGSRDEEMVTKFPSEDAMCRSLVLDTLLRWNPRTNAVPHETAIAPVRGRGIWQSTYPPRSVLMARGDGMLAIRDPSGLLKDPAHGAPQMTILDAATGVIRATWIPPHGVTSARFDEGNLVVAAENETASICDPATGRVLGATNARVPIIRKDSLLPNVLRVDRYDSRLHVPGGKLIWMRKGWAQPVGRMRNLSIINVRDPGAVEAVRDDGDIAWITKGSAATVTPDVVWIDAGWRLRIIDIETGTQLSWTSIPWGDRKLDQPHNGWDPSDGFVLVDDGKRLAAYSPTMERGGRHVSPVKVPPITAEASAQPTRQPGDIGLADLVAIFEKEGILSPTQRYRTYFDDATMTTYGDRDDEYVRTFASEDAMCRWLIADEFGSRPPRSRAVPHPSIITPTTGRARWQVSLPEHSHIGARGNGLVVVHDTSGLFVDPQHGARQITILDAATGSVLASWLPRHAALTTRFEGDRLIIDDRKYNASVCNPLTGEVLGTTEPRARESWADPLFPNILQRDKERHRSWLESPDGTLLWERPGWVRSNARRHDLSIINTANVTIVEGVRDDGTSAWKVTGLTRTVTADHVWVDAGEVLQIIDLVTGALLSSVPGPWSHFDLDSGGNGWNPVDNLVLVSDDTSLAAYPALFS